MWAPTFRQYSFYKFNMKKNFYQATRKARNKFYIELYSSSLYQLSIMIYIFGVTLLFAKVWELMGTFAFLTGLAMYFMARRRIAKKEIY